MDGMGNPMNKTKPQKVFISLTVPYFNLDHKNQLFNNNWVIALSINLRLKLLKLSLETDQ